MRVEYINVPYLWMVKPRLNFRPAKILQGRYGFLCFESELDYKRWLIKHKDNVI